MGTEDDAVVALLLDVVKKYGELNLCLTDLAPGQLADTSWGDSLIELARDLDDDELRAVLTRELAYLLHHPDGADRQDESPDLAVVLQFPDDGATLRELRRQTAAAAKAADPGEDTGSVPVPAPRHALADEDIPRSSVWVARRAERYYRISHH